MPDSSVIDRLFQTIDARRLSSTESSYTAKLFARGREKIAQKVGEEAVEVVIEAIKDDPTLLAQESADLLYHLLVLWADAGLEPEDVFHVLETRAGVTAGETKSKG